MDFKQFLTESENLDDVKKTLQKLPVKYRNLINKFKFDFQANNTMKGDKNHVGLIDTEKKKITIAAPWVYSREFVILHELAHLVFSMYMTTELKKEWHKIVKATKHKMKDTDEELFCHAFSASYCKHPPAIHYHDEWVKFIKKIALQDPKME